MSNAGPYNQDGTLVDLLIKQVTEGLSPVEQNALDAFDPGLANAKRRDLEQMVAALSAGIIDNTEVPPSALRASIEQQARSHFTSTGKPTEDVVDFKPASSKLDLAVVQAEGRRSGMGAWLAAAACFMLAIIGWMRPMHTVLSPPATEVNLTVPPAVIVKQIVPAPRPPSPEQERGALMARSDTVKVRLAATKDPAAAGVSADVVWDPATQTGFLHLVGLKSNDPRVQQYQAWIFDGTRDKRYPIDVAIFNVLLDASEVIVPIHAAIPVRVAKAFAVTVEKPGGVVVPDKAHVVVLGAPG